MCRSLPFYGVWEQIDSDEFDRLLNQPGVEPVDHGFVLTPAGNRSKTKYSEFSDGRSTAIRIEQGPTYRKLFSFNRVPLGD